MSDETKGIGQVRWYRLMAEEIRTELEEYTSGSARETMALVARNYDGLAQNLERRLTLTAVENPAQRSAARRVLIV